MSLKTVEMQVALPRTLDASKLSEQLQQRSQLANDLAAAQNQKESELKRTSVVKEERKAEAKLHRENHEHPNHQSSRQRSMVDLEEEKHEKQEKKEKHPYKGLKFDISG